jgi:outer membrane protein OmpA-like peptidoglycan-associated protein
MQRLIGIHTLSFLALGFVLMPVLSCTTGARLRGQAEEIKSQNEEIHDRAYRCAPKEIAVAESEVEFGLYELSQGDFVRAKQHIYRAEQYSKLADQASNKDACKPEDVSMEVDKTEAVEVEEGPRDQDGDGLIDENDECPLDPEDFDGFEDEDGCPDKDNDDDGLQDSEDACPNVAEDKDGYRDSDGCPDKDNDGDGILDINDQCSGEAEDFDGYQDQDGCPDRDNDDDGIADTLDQCPGEAEDYDGDKDDDGCPEERERVKVTKDRIELNEKVHFAYDSSDIQEKSYPLLDEVASVLQENPDIEVRVEGHTDSRGGEEYNLELSDKRAQSVVDYLTDKGLDRGRLQAKGFGEKRPIESNSTEAGRAANRRVEIHITDRE